MTDDETFRYVQHVARSQLAWRGPLDALVQLVATAKRQHGIEPDLARTEILLRRPSVQLLLRTHYEVACWRATDGEFRLVSLAVNPSAHAARRRLAAKRQGSESCTFCRIDEGAQASFELRPEFNRLGEPIPGSRVHLACRRALMELRELAAQAREESAA